MNNIDLDITSGGLEVIHTDESNNPELGIDKKDRIICEQFRNLFSGREDCWGKLRGGCIKERLTDSHFLRHLRGQESIGIYPLVDDGTCNFAAIDFDFKDKEDRETLAQHSSEKVREELYKIGIEPCWTEISKSGLIHVWIFFKTPVEAKLVRRLLQTVLERLEIEIGNGKVEIFPKQDYLKEGGVGNYIHLPYFGVLSGSIDKRIFVDPITFSPLDLEDFLNRASDNKVSLDKNMTSINEVKHDVETYRSNPHSRLTPEEIKVIMETISPYWKKGQRHQLALCLSGYLANQGINPGDSLGLVTELSIKNDDEEMSQRRTTVVDTYSNYREGSEILGFNGLKEILEPHDLEKLTQLLNSKFYDLIDKSDSRWPRPLSRKAYHGITGELIDFIEPHSEADPAAILFSFLTGMGNIIGPNIYYRVEAKKHVPRLFAVIVGDTSKARKGTSFGYIEYILTTIDPDFKKRLQSGLSTGEGLIKAVSDSEHKVLTDKRLLVKEEEFSKVLKMAAREGNILSQTIRDAWDSENFQTMTKYDALRVENAHISIIGHITQEELKTYFTSIEMANGFGNRFLWICSKRSKLLPFGGELDYEKLTPFIERLKKVVEFSSEIKRITWSNEAEPIWVREYSRLSEGGTGIIGAMTARAEAYVVRLASLYAILDLTTEIRPEHVFAALEVWRYSEDSVRCIFGDKSYDSIESKILTLMEDKKFGVSRTEISNLFHRNQNSYVLDQSLEKLEREGRIRCETDNKTGGRPKEMFYINSTH